MTGQTRAAFGSPEYQQQVWEAFAPARAAVQQMSDEIAEASQKFSVAIRPLADAILAFGTQLADALWTEYRAAGMPYGESVDAMMLWFKHRSEIARAEEEFEDRRTTEIALERVRAKMRATDG